MWRVLWLVGCALTSSTGQSGASGLGGAWESVNGARQITLEVRDGPTGPVARFDVYRTMGGPQAPVEVSLASATDGWRFEVGPCVRALAVDGEVLVVTESGPCERSASLAGRYVRPDAPG